MSVYCCSLLDCETGFKMVAMAWQGNASRCQQLDRKKRISLEECLKFSKSVGANAVNYHKKKCYPKLCKGKNLKLTDRFGGYDVYMLMGMNLMNDRFCLLFKLQT